MLNTTRQHRRPRIRTALTALALAGLLATLAACNTGASFGVDDQDPNVRGTFSGYFMWATEEPTTALGAVEPAAAADLVERAADAIAPDRDPRFGISIVATFATPEAAEEQAAAVREILAASASWYADPANEAAAAQLSDDERPAPFTPPEKQALEKRLLAPGERGVGWGGDADRARDAVYAIGPILVVTGLKSETADEAQAGAEVGADPPLHPLAHLLAAAGGDVLLEGDRYGEGSIVADVLCRPADGESATALLDELGDAILIGGQFWARPPWIGEPLTPKEALARATFRRWQQGAAAALSDPKLQDLAQRIASSTPAESEAAMREFEAHIRERGLELMDGEFDPGVLALILDTGSQADDDARQAWTRELGERMGRLAVEEGPYGDQPTPDDYAQVPFTGSVRVNAERLEIGWLSFARLAAGLPSLAGYLTARGCDDIRVKLVDYGGCAATNPAPVLSSRPRRVDPSRMTIRTPPSRTTTPVAPRRSAPDALVVRRGDVSIGRARAAAPLRREGPDKLTGLAKYADDLVFPGAWFGATIRSTDAHARFIAFDLDPAFDWSKVAVVTAADIPGDNIVSLISDDQPVLVPVGGEIQHHAEPLVLLAAADRETLRAARRHVSVRTEKLAPIFDPLVSEHVFAHYEIAAGNLDAGFAQADFVLEGTYRVGHQEQLYIENNAMIAVPREDGGVAVHGSLQCPYYIHKALKRSLKLSDSQAQVVQAETGGGFGGKEEYPSIIALHAALLARKTGKPVRMIYDRHEDLSATTKRHPAIVTHRTGVKLDGTLVAQDIEVVMDGGAYCTLTPVVLSRGAIHSGGPYRCQNVRIRARATRTNTPPNGAFRGFGAPQVEFAAEIQVDRLAEAIGLSPLEIRRRNLYQVGDTTPTGQVLRDSVAASEVLERAAEAAEFEGVRARTTAARARRAGSGNLPGSPLRTAPERTASGIGVALAWHGAGFTGSGEVKLASVASVELGADGRIRVLTASTEMGQGTKTIFPQLVAAELGVAYEDVEIAPQDTAIVPDSGPTVASRTAMVVGGLLIKAARSLKAKVEERSPGRNFASVYREDAATHGPTRIDQRFEPYPGVHFDDATYHGDAYPAFGWAACVASVDVDLDSGEVTVRDVVAVDDIGKVIHPTLAEGQVEGGTLQAIGYATIEEIKLRDGRYLNDRLATYIIPTSLDAPRITSILVEAPFASAPHGAKGVGELPMDVGAPAVVAAIHDATGAWIHDLPATPERILAAMGATPRTEAPAGLPWRDVEPTVEAPIEQGTDPRPEARTDPQPLRGPQPDGDKPRDPTRNKPR